MTEFITVMRYIYAMQKSKGETGLFILKELIWERPTGDVHETQVK